MNQSTASKISANRILLSSLNTWGSEFQSRILKNPQLININSFLMFFNKFTLQQFNDHNLVLAMSKKKISKTFRTNLNCLILQPTITGYYNLILLTANQKLWQKLESKPQNLLKRRAEKAQDRRIKTKQKLLKVKALFIWLCL